MCGIFGAIDLGGSFDATDFDRFVAATDLVRYRGPDDAGYVAISVPGGTVATTPGAPFDVFLGFRRLSIIDLSAAGHQPMTDGMGRWLIFNGEIFNYIELRDELRQQGHVFHTETDTEVILKVYAVYGEEGFSRLNGMWAFALVDLPKRRVILSRDRFSIKPLYYARVGDRLFFGSEIKQLLGFLPRRAPNPGILRTYLVQGIVDHSEETFFEGVLSLRPMRSLLIDLATRQTREHRYWDYAAPGTMNVDDGIEQTRALFIDSIRIRLRSDVQVGVLLSGGLDSSAIAVVANDLLNAKLEMYSVIAKDQRYSEERFIDILLDRPMRGRKLSFESPNVLTMVDEVIRHNDEPLLGFQVVAHFDLLKRVRQETKTTVILSGQGGDECFLGYSKFFFFHVLALFKSNHPVQATRLLWSSFLRGTTVRQFRLGEARRYLPFAGWRPGGGYVRVAGEDEPVGIGNGLRARQQLDIDKYSVPALNHYEDRTSMAHSLEIRTPFLDHRLVDLALNLPVGLKLQDGWTKYAMRKAFPEIPDAIRWRRDKQGFITPEEQWLRDDLRERILTSFNGSKLQQLGLIDDRLFRQYYERFLAGDSRIWYADITRAFLAERWAQQFIDAA